MIAAIKKIKVMERLRKEITRIPELAADMQKNGLINPVTVLALDGGEYQLLAGLRRIQAAQSLGWPEIEINVVTLADAESALSLEISENEQREPFTYSEKMDCARMIERIESVKARERMLSGKNVEQPDPVTERSQGSGRTRDIVGAKLDMSGTQYSRAKYVAENAPPEVIDQLDSGERSIYGTYEELRAMKKAAIPSEPDNPPQAEPMVEPATKEKNASKKQSGSQPPNAPANSESVTEEVQMRNLSEKDREGVRKLQEFSALSPEGKITELQRQLREQRARAATAESDLAMLREQYGISVDHKDSIIDSLKRQNAELSDALTAANARIAELETSSQ